jgi:hypothetical protein
MQWDSKGRWGDPMKEIKEELEQKMIDTVSGRMKIKTIKIFG